MKKALKVLALLCTFLPMGLAPTLSSADFLDRGVSHRPNRINPFVSQQMVKSPVGQKPVSQKLRAYQMPQKMRAYQMPPLSGGKQPLKEEAAPRRMRPGRNYDNPAANRFGDGSQPNTYIWGSGRSRQTP